MSEKMDDRQMSFLGLSEATFDELVDELKKRYPCLFVITHERHSEFIDGVQIRFHGDDYRALGLLVTGRRFIEDRLASVNVLINAKKIIEANSNE